jgi:hypothetical protein
MASVAELTLFRRGAYPSLIAARCEWTHDVAGWGVANTRG